MKFAAIVGAIGVAVIVVLVHQVLGAITTIATVLR